MKKLFTFLILVFTITSFTFPLPIQAGNGEQCRAAGYECKPLTQCPSDQWLGTVDCPQVGPVGTICCGTPKQLSCGDSCVNAAECPSSCPACIGVCRVAPSPSLAPSPPSFVSCIPTAIGCIDFRSPSEFVNNILRLAIGLAGGIAMLLIIFGGIQILTSAGNPEKIQAGKELITSAIAGLILIVFSVFILRIIGVEVLNIFE